MKSGNERPRTDGFTWIILDHSQKDVLQFLRPWIRTRTDSVQSAQMLGATESHTDEPYFCPPAPEWWAFTDWEFTWYIEFCQERTPASSEEAAWLNHCHINRFHTSNVVHFQISLSLSVSFSTLHLVHHAAIMLELPGLPSESEWVTVMIRNLPNNYGRNDVPCWRSRLYLVVWL